MSTDKTVDFGLPLDELEKRLEELKDAETDYALTSILLSALNEARTQRRLRRFTLTDLI